MWNQIRKAYLCVLKLPKNKSFPFCNVFKNCWACFVMLPTFFEVETPCAHLKTVANGKRKNRRRRGENYGGGEEGRKGRTCFDGTTKKEEKEGNTCGGDSQNRRKGEHQFLISFFLGGGVEAGRRSIGTF